MALVLLLLILCPNKASCSHNLAGQMNGIGVSAWLEV